MSLCFRLLNLCEWVVLGASTRDEIVCVCVRFGSKGNVFPSHSPAPALRSRGATAYCTIERVPPSTFEVDEVDEVSTGFLPVVSLCVCVCVFFAVAVPLSV